MKNSSATEGVLIMSNDFLTPFAKTSDYLAAALERRGIPAYVRDNAEARLLTYLFSEEMAPRRPQAQEAICESLRELIEYARIDTVISLDLNWYVTPGLFVDDPAIRSIHSLWFDDFRSWCTSPFNPCFSDGDVFQQHVKHPKVTHHFYGDSQALEARLLGVSRQRLTRLASVYRRYPAHLNAANCARDATANEKLFEIAACARLSLNLDSPDVRACYSNDEIILADSDEALEAEAEKVLRDPAAAIALGETARKRTASEHLWEHRLKKALA